MGTTKTDNRLSIVPVAGVTPAQWRVLRHVRRPAPRLVLVTEVLLTATTLKAAKQFVKSYTPPTGDESDGNTTQTPGGNLPGSGTPEDDPEDGGTEAE